MKIYAPNYYKKFKCIADKCNHNCCIGWEIDIDDETLDFYKTEREILDKIDLTPTPHFILKGDGRCPFLDSKNLCKIIKKHGEERLCQICRDHPRFFNFYDTRCEYGLGLVCEAATKLILDNDFFLEEINDDGFLSVENELEVDFFKERETLFRGNHSTLKQYIPNIPLNKLAEELLKLERLDNEWDNYLNCLNNNTNSLKSVDIENHTLWKNLFCYFLYRHFYNTSLEFCLLCTNFIFALDGDIYEICRIFSGEIEYSDENIEKVMTFIK